MTNGKQKKNQLTPKEQKTTVAFKLMSKQVKTLEKSLKLTQNELEKYREKYYEADKNQAVEASKNSGSKFHEFLKFAVSVILGGLGVNAISDHLYIKGGVFIGTAVILYALIVFFDKK